MKDQLDGRIQEVGSLNVAMRDLEDENARLTAIVDKLPKTKDGVSVCPGDAVYDPVDGLVYTVWEFFKHSGRWFAVTVHRTLAIGECYSTPEAAEAAKEVKT